MRSVKNCEPRTCRISCLCNCTEIHAVTQQYLFFGEGEVHGGLRSALVVGHAEGRHRDDVALHLVDAAAEGERDGCAVGLLEQAPEERARLPLLHQAGGFGDFMYDLGYSLWSYGSLQEQSVAMLEEAGYGFSEN